MGSIDGVLVTALKQISHPQGDVYHGLKATDSGFAGFGEAYFSTVTHKEIKAWKKHKEMTLNFIVPVGEIKVVIYDDRSQSSTRGNFFEITLSKNNYCRLTIPHGLWVGFCGIGKEMNLLLNVANLVHDPLEVEKLDMAAINYNWN